MIIELKRTVCVVTREPDDPKYYGVRNAAGESALFYAIKKQLNAQGFDLVKKRMNKDGHWMPDMQQYIKTRKPSGDPDKDIYIYNGHWQMDGADVDFNSGQVILQLDRDVFNAGKSA